MTRRELTLSSLAAAFSSFAAAGVVDAAETQPAGRIGPAMALATKQLAAAMLAADKAKLEALLAPQLSFGHSNGLVQTKAEFIQSVVSRQEVFKTIELTGQAAQVVNEDAIVRQTFASDLVFQGKDVSVKLSELQIWQRQSGVWRLIARQAFRT